MLCIVGKRSEHAKLEARITKGVRTAAAGAAMAAPLFDQTKFFSSISAVGIQLSTVVE